MRLDHRAIMRRAVDGDLELARQEREFRMKRRPLPQDFGVRARVGDLVMRDAGEMVGGDIADAVSRGLDRVHLDARELGQDVGRVLERRPVELDVLPGGEMAVAAIVIARDLGELAHLARVEHAIGNGDAQHIGVELQVEAVHQAMRAELLLGQFAAEAARDLVAELLDARGDEGGVEIVIMIHGRSPSRPWDPSGAPDQRLLAQIAPDRRPRRPDRLAQSLGREMAVALLDHDRIGVDDEVVRLVLLRPLQRFRRRLADRAKPRRG